MISLHEYLEKEGITAPPIYLNFFFAVHTTEEDGIDVIEHSKSSNIIALELVRWDIVIDKLLNEVSFGKKPPTLQTSEKLFYASTNFENGLLKAAYDIHKPFIFFDFPSSDPSVKDLDVVMNQGAELYSPPIHMDGEYVNKLPSFKDWCSKFAELQKKREEYMEDSFMKALKGVLISNPALLNENKIEISLFLGKFHTTIYHHFKEANPDTSIAFQHNSDELPLSAELFLQLMHGKEVTDQEYQLAFIESIATLYTLGSGMPREKQIPNAKILTKTLSIEETKHLYSLIESDNEADIKAFLKEKATNIDL